VSLGQFAGKKPVLLVFWATWCPHCNEAVPAINEMRSRMSDRLQILAIDFMESGEKVKSFMKRKNVTYPTRPRPTSSAAAWERPQRAAPLWPDRVLEAAVAVVVALGAAATLAFLFPIELGPAPGPAAPAGPGVDPVLRAFTGVAGLSSGKDGNALTGATAALGALCAAAGAFFALAFLDRGPERGWRARRPIVFAGLGLFVALLCVAVLGKARP
jgi:thiol-disulfide isomerase/thioredoxin